MSSKPEYPLPRERRRVLFLNNSVFHGGVERQIHYTKRELEKRGWRAFFIYFNPHNRENVSGAEYRYLPWRRYFSRSPRKFFALLPFLLRVLRFVRQERITVIHTYGPYENLVAALVARLSAARHIASVRTNRRWAFRFIRLWGPLSRIVLTNAEEIRKTLHTEYRLPERKLAVLRNGIDIDRFPFMEKGELDAAQLTIGLIGRISTSKNQLSFLEAFYRWHRRRQPSFDFSFLLLGTLEDREYYERLLRWVEEHGLEEKISIVPWSENVLSYYRQMDLIALPSISEGLPNVLLEAMALGIPWTASDVADVGHLARLCGYEDFLFDPYSEASMQEALERLFSHPFEELKHKIVQGRRAAERDFSLEALGRRTEELYIRAAKR